MATMQVIVTLSLVFGITCCAKGLINGSLNRLGSSYNGYRNPNYQRYMTKVSNGSRYPAYSGFNYNLGRLGNILGVYGNYGANYPMDSSMRQVSPGSNYPAGYYGWGGYGQNNPLSSMSAGIKRPVGLNYGRIYNNPMLLSMRQVSPGSNYPAGYYGWGGYGQNNPLSSMSAGIKRPVGLNYGRIYNNPMLLSMRQVSPGSNYPAGYYEWGGYGQNNPLSSMSAGIKRPVGLNYGRIYNNPMLLSMRQVSPGSNYPAGYYGWGGYGQNNPLSSMSAGIKRPVGLNYGRIYNNPMLLSMRQVSPGSNYPAGYYGWGGYGQNNPLSSMSAGIKRPVGLNYGRIYNNPMLLSMRQVSPGSNYPAGYYGWGGYGQNNPLSSMSAGIKRPVGLNYGRIYNNPMLLSMRQVSPGSNYPAGYYGWGGYGQNNPLSSMSAGIKRPVGLNYGRIYNNPMLLSMRQVSPGSNYPAGYYGWGGYGQNNPLSSMSAGIQRPVVLNTGGIYNNPMLLSMRQVSPGSNYPAGYYGWGGYGQNNPLSSMSAGIQRPVRLNSGGIYNNPMLLLMRQVSPGSNYPAGYYGWGGYGQNNPLSSMSAGIQRPVGLNTGGIYNNPMLLSMRQVSPGYNYPAGYYGWGGYGQNNPLSSMSAGIQRPVVLNTGGIYNNPMLLSMRQVSPGSNYPAGYYGWGGYGQNNPLSSMSAGIQRPVRLNSGGIYNNPMLLLMRQVSPGSNYPAGYYGWGGYGQNNPLSSMSAGIQRPVGLNSEGIYNNPMLLSMRQVSTGSNYPTGYYRGGSYSQRKPLDTISRVIQRPVFGGIYKGYGENLSQSPVRYYGYSLGSPLVSTYRVLYPKTPVVTYITDNIHYGRALGALGDFITSYPIQPSASTVSHGVSSPLISGGGRLGIPVGQWGSPVSYGNNPTMAYGGLGFRSMYERYGAPYPVGAAPGTLSRGVFQPIVLGLGNLNSEYKSYYPAATSISGKIQNIPNAIYIGPESLHRGQDYYGNGYGHYPAKASFSTLTRRPIGYHARSHSYGTQYPVGQSVNTRSYVKQNPFAYGRSALRGLFGGYKLSNPTGSSTRGTQYPVFYERSDLGGPTGRYGVQLPINTMNSRP